MRFALIISALLATAEGFSAVAPSAVATSTENMQATMHQQRAGEIVSSFEPREFKPVPWLSNCHLQTIGGVYLRQDCGYVVDDNIGTTLSAAAQTLVSPRTEDADYWDRRERIDTPDGDWFHLDFKANSGSSKSKGLMVMIHGLESNSRSPLMTDMANSYLALGLDVCCINFRGCSGEPNDTLGAYHLGFTNDLKHYLELLYKDGTTAQTPIYLSAFSLGANMMIRALGELQDEAVSKYNIKGAAFFCCPLNCEKHYKRLMEPGINRSIYTGTLLKSMKGKAQLQLERVCDNDPDTTKFDYRAAMEAETIYEFENAFIAPIYGFEDPIDYFRKTAAIHVMEDVAVPTFVLNAADDPFMDGTYQPTEVTVEEGGRAPVKMTFSEAGGHCGFLFHQEEESATAAASVSSWGPSEMARFIQHVIENNEESNR